MGLECHICKSFLICLIYALTFKSWIQVEGASARFRLVSYYTDNMVLQREPSSAIIWGYGKPSAQVTLKFLKYKFKTKIEASGIWSITVPPQPAGGPHLLTFLNGPLNSSRIILHDVYFGDVWFCSGQSNMEFEMFKILDSKIHLARAQEYKYIRFLKTPKMTSKIPKSDLLKTPAPWSGPNFKSLREFSALCWLYGQFLFDELLVPIGLVESTWGGTPIECWSSPDVLSSCGLSFQENVDHSGPDIGIVTDNSVLWNAMINPYLRMVIRGAIWYQGEANLEYHLHSYNCTFPAMIDDWRRKWWKQTNNNTNRFFNFGFMQLATNGYYNDSTSAWGWIRWHQTMDYGYVPNRVLPGVFMAVAMDLPDDTSPYGRIHPRDKYTMSVRLGEAGLRVAYNKLKYSSKGPQAYLILKNETTVYLLYNEPIELRTTVGFEYCCCKWCGKDMNKWLRTDDVVLSSNRMLILRTKCKPNILVYNWRERPCNYKQCAVYGTYQNDYLPAPPWKWKI